MTQPNPPATANLDTLYQDIRQLIEAAKTHVATQVNQALVLTYWQIGKTIKTELLQDARSEYGLATLKQLAQQLQQEYGADFSYSSLTRMIKFYSYLPEQTIVATVSQQLSWSHFVELKRGFYIRMCSEARWPLRTLRERMDGMPYERTTLSKQTDGNFARITP
jgi:DUF1016 N-terminal domain